MSFDINQIISYREMCDAENHPQLQQGMNFNIGNGYSVVLMSVKPNAPYADRISDDGLTIYYEGHDVRGDKLKRMDQQLINPGGTLTQNGMFVDAINRGKHSGHPPLVKIYEKIKMGIWTYRGLFIMSEAQKVERGNRNVYEYVCTITDQTMDNSLHKSSILVNDLEQTRQIPGRIKLAVYKRDKGQCVKCGKQDNLHFDHILPYAKGGTSLKEENIQLLCARHNLEKSDKLDV